MIALGVDVSVSRGLDLVFLDEKRRLDKRDLLKLGSTVTSHRCSG
jgi:hypothetical protein